jgi:tetratricopeptide (TPR) repeat protein
MKPLELLISALKLTFYGGCVAITLTRCGLTPTLSIPIPDSSYLIISKEQLFISKKLDGSDHPNIVVEGIVNTMKGLENESLGNKKDTLDAYNQAIKSEPNNDVYYSNRGMFFVESGDDQAGLNDYNTAIKLNPRNSITYDNRGLLKMKIGDIKGALSDYNLAIKFDPNYAASYANRSQIHISNGDIHKATNDLKKAAAIYKQEGRAEHYQSIIKVISEINNTSKK